MLQSLSLSSKCAQTDECVLNPARSSCPFSLHHQFKSRSTPIGLPAFKLPSTRPWIVHGPRQRSKLTKARSTHFSNFAINIAFHPLRRFRRRTTSSVPFSLTSVQACPSTPSKITWPVSAHGTLGTATPSRAQTVSTSWLKLVALSARQTLLGHQ